MGPFGRNPTSPRSPRVARSVIVLVWALSSLLAGSVVWWAVAVIGGEQAAARDLVQNGSQVAAALAEQTTALGSRPTATPSPTSSSAAVPVPEPSAAPTPLGQPPAPEPTPSTTPTQRSQPTTRPAPTIAPPVAQAPVDSEVARTWDVSGGQVAASCHGARIALLYATPQNGWTVEIKSSGPEQVEVSFHRNGAETELHAACASGTPQMQTGGGSKDD